MTKTADRTEDAASTRKRLLLIIPINESQYNEPLKGFLAPYLAPDFDLDVKNIEQGTKHIASRWDLQENGTHIARLVHEIGKQYDGIFISDFDGAGMEAAREVVRIPVVDGFLPQCMAALTLSSTFSIIAPDDALVSLDISHPRMMGVAAAMSSVRSLGLSIADLGDPTKSQLVEDAVYEQAEQAIEHDGALAILLGCTALIGVAAKVSKRLRNRKVDGKDSPLDVPVMDPNICGLTHLQALVRAGLAQCGRSYGYPPNLSRRI